MTCPRHRHNLDNFFFFFNFLSRFCPGTENDCHCLLVPDCLFYYLSGSMFVIYFASTDSSFLRTCAGNGEGHEDDGGDGGVDVGQGRHSSRQGTSNLDHRGIYLTVVRVGVTPSLPLNSDINDGWSFIAIFMNKPHPPGL